MKKVILSLALGAFALGASAQDGPYTISFNIEGDNYGRVYFTDMNEPLLTKPSAGWSNPNDMEYDQYYKATGPVVTYSFYMPFETDVNTPGLTITCASGYKMQIELANAEELGVKQGNMNSGGDYSLDNGGGGGGFFSSGLEPAGTPGMGSMAYLDLFSAKMDGAVFTITLEAIPGPDYSQYVTFRFSGVTWSGDEAVDEATLNMIVNQGSGNVTQAVIGNFTMVPVVDGGTKVIFTTLYDGQYDLDFYGVDMEEGPDTFTVEKTKGKYFGWQWNMVVYPGARGKTIRVVHGDPEDEETTGVSAMENAPETVVYYDLQGRRVENPVKGIYVANGRKVVVR